MRDVKSLSRTISSWYFLVCCPGQLEPIYSLLINCILYFLSRSFQLNSRNLEMNVNSVEVTNFRQILTLLRAINYGNVRFISGRDLTNCFANCHPRFWFPLRGGRGNISAPSSLCFQNMDELLTGRIVLKYHSSCWFSLFLLTV